MIILLSKVERQRETKRHSERNGETIGIQICEGQ